MTVSCIRHAGIVVHDIERMSSFYRDALGLHIWADFRDASPYIREVTGVKNADVHMIKLSSPDGVSIELLKYVGQAYQLGAHGLANTFGMNHIAMQTEDVDALYEKILAHGGSASCRPKVSPDGNAKVTYCRDPEGNIVEIVQILTP